MDQDIINKLDELKSAINTPLGTSEPLAAGQLPNSQGTLYTSPAGHRAINVTLIAHNLNAAAQTIIIYHLRSGGSARVIGRAVLSQYQTMVMDDENRLSLSPGDAIQGVTTTAAAVDYTLFGTDLAA